MNENFIDKQLLHQVRLEKVENGIIENLIKRLESANRKSKSILLETKGIETKKRYTEISKQIEKITKELKNDLSNEMSIEEFIEYELKSQKSIFKDNNINLVYPSKEQLITSSLFAPYSESSTFKSYLDSFSSQFYNTWDSSIRNGYLLGIPTQKIVRDVIGELAKNAQVQEFGLMQKLKNSIKANSRTILQAMANETRECIFKKNEDIFSGYKFYATLDKRSCLVCGSLDGLVKKRIEDFGVRIPLHYNCRCVILPIVKGFEDMEDTRASKDGQVSDNLTYEKWLERQSNEDKKYILGKSRFELYEKGKKFTSFVSDENRIIPLDKIEKSFENLITSNTKTEKAIFHTVNSNEFSKILAETKMTVDENDRWRVSSYDAKHYDESKCICRITDNKSTVAVTESKDIISVCRKVGDKGKDLIAEGVRLGGVKLDSYDGNFGFYVKQGFEPISWCKFDEQYAPDGWIKGKNDPEHIIFFKYVGIGKTTFDPNNLQSFYDKVKASADYDIAEKIRDKLL